MFAQRLKELRAMKEISQAKLANIFGCAQQTVARWETETTEPDIATLIRLADYFGVSVDYLIGHKRKSRSFDECMPTKSPLLQEAIRVLKKEELEQLEHLARYFIRKQGGRMK